MLNKVLLYVIHFLVQVLLVGMSSSVYAQNSRIQQKTYPQYYFRPPLDLAPQAAGNFGELRLNHFHSGTDYRTNQREGYPVYAAADGFISRARVQIGGGGNALYIDHPNGYTSVYMHLQRFNDRIAPIVKAKQYESKRFDVDFPLSPSLVPVKKGEIIAYSGNTGGTAGPHLHFELRDTKTEHTINAQLFGLTIPDRIPPTINGITVYRLGAEVYSENTPREHLLVTGSSGKYQLHPANTIFLTGPTGFGITTSDLTSASANRNGIYSIELLLDNKLIYSNAFETFSFDNSRAVNSYIDYASYILHRRWIQKSFIEPGNHLEIYQTRVNNGIIELTDEQAHQVTYRVKDVLGNTSVLTFPIKKIPANEIGKTEKSGTVLFPYNQDNTFKNERVSVHIPVGNLYSNLYFSYKEGERPTNGFSAIQQIHNRMVPVHDGYRLSIQAQQLPERLQEKALIVNVQGASQGGIYQNGYVTTTAKTFGSFYIAVDTIPPLVRSLTLYPNKNLTAISRINFKISDNLSGIQSFNGYLDGSWVLMEYDAKTASLWHVFEKNLTKGKHHFKLAVKDWKNNERLFEADFIK